MFCHYSSIFTMIFNAIFRSKDGGENCMRDLRNISKLDLGGSRINSITIVKMKLTGMHTKKLHLTIYRILFGLICFIIFSKLSMPGRRSAIVKRKYIVKFMTFLHNLKTHIHLPFCIYL